MLGEQLVADVVEIADDRHRHADLEQALLDVRHGGGGLVAVDRDAHDLGTGGRQRRDLADGPVDIGRVGVGHRLDDDRGAAAHEYAAHVDRHRSAARGGGGEIRHSVLVHLGLVPNRAPKSRYVYNIGARTSFPNGGQIAAH